MNSRDKSETPRGQEKRELSRLEMIRPSAREERKRVLMVQEKIPVVKIERGRQLLGHSLVACSI